MVCPGPSFWATLIAAAILMPLELPRMSPSSRIREKIRGKASWSVIWT